MNLRTKIGAGLLWGLWAPAAIAGGMALAPLHALAALLLTPWPKLLGMARRHLVWLAPTGLFIAWAALSQFWSLFPDTPQTIKFGFGVVAVIGLCLGLRAAPPAQARGFVWFAVFAVAALAAFEIFEAVTDMALNRIFQPDAIDWRLARNPGKGAAILLVTGPAAAIWLAFSDAATAPRRIAAGAIALACAFVSLQFGMDANLVACVLAFGAATAAARAPRMTLRVFAIVVPAALLLAPLLYAALSARLSDVTMGQSWMHRIEIWRAVTDAIGQKPLCGWGMDATRELANALGPGVSIPLHAHSTFLQIWVELGLVGAACAAAAIGLGGWRLADRIGANRLHGAAAAAVLGAAGTSWTLSFSLWQEWYLAGAGIAAALVAAITNAQAADKAGLNR